MTQVLKASLATINPHSNPDALSGLVLLLRSQPPTGPLLSTVLSLSAKFGRFGAVVLAGWTSSNYPLLLSCLQQLCATDLLLDGRLKQGEDNEDNHSDNSGLQQ